MLEPLIGIICLFAGDYNPAGWLPCDGKLYPISYYPSLYSVIGTAYGGDIGDSFAVPDLIKSVPEKKENHLNYIIAYEGIMPSPLSRGPECYMGHIYLFAGTIVPKGWSLCNGQLLKIGQNSSTNMIYSIIGNRYGGDGKEGFSLPDLTLPVSEGKKGYLNYIICLDGIYPKKI